MFKMLKQIIKNRSPICSNEQEQMNFHHAKMNKSYNDAQGTKMNKG